MTKLYLGALDKNNRFMTFVCKPNNRRVIVKMIQIKYYNDRFCFITTEEQIICFYKTLFSIIRI